MDLGNFDFYATLQQNVATITWYGMEGDSPRCQFLVRFVEQSQTCDLMDVISRVGYLKDSDEQLVSGIDNNHHYIIVVVVASIRYLIDKLIHESIETPCG